MTIPEGEGGQDEYKLPGKALLAAQVMETPYRVVGLEGEPADRQSIYPWQLDRGLPG